MVCEAEYHLSLSGKYCIKITIDNCKDVVYEDKEKGAICNRCAGNYRKVINNETGA